MGTNIFIGRQPPWTKTGFEHSGTSIILLLSLIILSCSDPIERGNPVSSEHEVLWPVSPVQNYIIDQRRACFCPPPWGFVRLTVINNKIVAGVDLENDTPLTEEELQRYRTIDELFKLVEKAKRRPAAVLKVDYDPTFGYPCYIYVDWNRDVIDEEIAFVTHLVRFFP
ncbi:MAG: DUF6174 domain-containing protein [Candidatus Zixiibacteriota bacterium]